MGPALPAAKVDPPRKPSLREMQLAIAAEAERMEIVAEALRSTGVGNSGPTEARRIRVYREAVRVLELIEVHQEDFAKLVKKARGR